MIATIAPTFSRTNSPLVDRLGIPYEEVLFPTNGNLSLRGWFFPAVNPDAPVILYAHATSHDQRSGISLVAPLHEAGYHVLLFSYRGHGRSEGSRFGFTYGAAESEDVDAAVNYLFETRGIHRIGAIGHSAGAVSVILSAARNTRIRAVIAASPFSTMEEVWETNRPAIFPRPLFHLTMNFSEFRKGFSRLDVCPQDVIARISPRPLLLIHGSEDKRITQEQINGLFHAAKQPKRLWILDGSDHAQVRNPGLDTLAPNLIRFFDEYFKKPVAPQST